MEIKRYFGCRVKQRIDNNTVPFFIFYARINDLKQWVGIRRSEDLPEGTQRILRPARKKQITRFLASSAVNTIPNNILLAFDPGCATFTPLDDRITVCFPDIDSHNECENQLEWGILEFSFEPGQEDHLRPALIIDGQHRFYGMADFAQEDLAVLIVSLIDANIEEQAFQFIVINSKAVKVSTVNAKSIIGDMKDEGNLIDRLLKAGVNYADQPVILRDINDLTSSPFQALLKWDYNRGDNKLVELTAIEQALKYLHALFTFLEDDEDSLLAIFFAIWNAVKASYPELWGNDSTLMKKVSMIALNEFIVDRLKMAWEFGILDIFETKKVENTTLDILKSIPVEFWQTKWSITIQDNANVRKMIKEDLERMVNNHKLRRVWHEDLQLFEIGEAS